MSIHLKRDRLVGPDYFQRLPEEIVYTIFQTNFSLTDLYSCYRTCRRWCAILQDEVIQKLYLNRLLSPFDQPEQREVLVSDLIGMMGKLHLTPPPNPLWIQKQLFWSSRKMCILVDNSSSITNAQRWTMLKTAFTRFIKSLGFLSSDGVYVSASERNYSQYYTQGYLKTEAEVPSFLGALDFPPCS